MVIAGAQTQSDPRRQIERETEVDSILAAKRDLAAVKAVKEGQFTTGLKGPSHRIVVPELRTESAAVPPPALRAVKPESKSDNWLIDGMAQSERDRRASGAPSRSTEAYGRSSRPGTNRDTGSRGTTGTTFGSIPEVGQNGRDSLDSRSPRGSRDGAMADRNDASSSRADEVQTTAAALNPLTQFLGDWMSPQDYALLRPGMETSSRGGVDRPGAAGSSLPGVPDFTLESSLQREIPGGFTTATPITSTESHRANPFLESLNRVEFPAPVRAIPPSIPPSPALVPNAAGQISPPPASAALVAPGRPSVPEFTKPGQDEKYFKQLKRF